MAADGRASFDQVDGEAFLRHIECRLHPGDAGADHQGFGNHVLKRDILHVLRFFDPNPKTQIPNSK
jgi:hypothetical protein